MERVRIEAGERACPLCLRRLSQGRPLPLESHLRHQGSRFEPPAGVGRQWLIAEAAAGLAPGTLVRLDELMVEADVRDMEIEVEWASWLMTVLDGPSKGKAFVHVEGQRLGSEAPRVPRLLAPVTTVDTSGGGREPGRDLSL